ncbi:MAG: MXAN_5187 C-terminal domain-containing protein, partial [Pseudomonadota bacterium]
MIDTGGRRTDEPLNIEELIEDLEHKVERLRTLYEQYFMGIAKVEPQTARKEVVRKMTELAQLNIRNTALRYRFNSLNQKWGVYLTYWNRTLRAIENGTYVRSIAKAGRDAARKGLDVPEEVLRKMPARMRERILRERARLATKARSGVGADADRSGSGSGGGEAASSLSSSSSSAAASCSASSSTVNAATGTSEAAAVSPKQRENDQGPSRFFSAAPKFDEEFDQLFDLMTSGPRANPLFYGDPGDAGPVARAADTGAGPDHNGHNGHNGAPPRPTPGHASGLSASSRPASRVAGGLEGAPAPGSTNEKVPLAVSGGLGASAESRQRDSAARIGKPGSTPATHEPSLPAKGVLGSTAGIRPVSATSTRNQPPSIAAAVASGGAGTAQQQQETRERAGAQAGRPKTPVVLPGGVDEASAQELFRRYVQAKKLLGEDTSNVRFEHIVQTIAKQAPAIMERHSAKSVEFSVVIKDDRVVVKASP